MFFGNVAHKFKLKFPQRRKIGIRRTRNTESQQQREDADMDMDMNLSLILCHLSSSSSPSSLFVYLHCPTTSLLIWLLCLALQFGRLLSLLSQLTSLVSVGHFRLSWPNLFQFPIPPPVSAVWANMSNILSASLTAYGLEADAVSAQSLPAIKCWRHSAEVSEITRDADQISWNITHNSITPVKI